VDIERVEIIPGLIIEIDTARFQLSTLPMMLTPAVSDFTVQVDLLIVDVLEGEQQRVENALKLRSR
jgi:hypothetical protein